MTAARRSFRENEMTQETSHAAEGWKRRLAGKMPADLAREIDVYETQLELKRQGKIDDKLCAKTRLRRGA